MDLLENLEIYIPVEAEVKNIDIWSLPNSVVRQMGLPQADSEGSRKPAESPEGIWICPAVLKRKGQKPSSTAHNDMIENISSLMGKVFQATSGPFRMSFVSSNHVAFRVLKDTMPGKKSSEDTSQTSMLSPHSALQSYQVAVVIYNGRIYLSIRRPNRKKSKRGILEPQRASHSATPSTSNTSSKPQKASTEPADGDIQRKRQRIILPQVATKQPKDLHTKTDHSTTDQKLLNDNNPKKKLNSCKVTQSENIKGVLHKGRDVSSCKAARSVPQSADSVHSAHSHYKEAAEDAADSEPAWFQPQGEQEQVAIIDGEIQDDSQNDMGRGKSDNNVGIVEQYQSEGVAPAPTSIQEFDFTELAHKEMIAQKKAKFKQATLGIMTAKSQ